MEQTGGILWLIINVVMVALLGVAIFMGVQRWRARRRRPEVERQRDAATRRLYDAAAERERQDGA